jgi:hypothetical protein
MGHAVDTALKTTNQPVLLNLMGYLLFYYRWLLYSPIGEPIAGTRLFSFKVPLKDVSNFNFSLNFFTQLVQNIIYTKGIFMLPFYANKLS